MVPGTAPYVYKRGFCSSKLLCYSSSCFGRYRRNLLGPFRGFIFHKLCILVEADRIIIYKLLVVPAVFHYLMPQSKSKCSVRARSDGNPFIGLCRSLVIEGIDVDHLCTLCSAPVPDPRKMGPLCGGKKVPAEDKSILRIGEIGEWSVITHHQLKGGLSCNIACIRMHREVRRTVKHVEIRLHVGERGVLRAPKHRFGSVFLPDA